MNIDQSSPQDTTNCEPLVRVDQYVPCLNMYRVAGWPGTVESTWLRQTVLDRLLEAQRALPSNFGLAVWDAWRSPTTIRALYQHFYGPGSTLPPGFLADPDGPHVPAHSTGGAVDVTLTLHGEVLELGTPFDEFTDLAAAMAFEDQPGEIRDRRRLLRATMLQAGFVGFDDEWWHFSFGDQAWADATGARQVLYGPCRP